MATSVHLSSGSCSCVALQRVQAGETGGRGAESKPQASFARRFGQRLDAAVVEVAAAVEDDRLDLRVLCVPGQQLADLGRLLGLRALERAQVQPTRRGQGVALEVVDQ